MAFPAGWLRKCKLTIQNGKIDDTLSNFPVLITETCLPQGNNEIFDADGAHPAQNGGGDIRFSASEDGTNQLDCEIVTFTTDNNPASGKAELWVKVPSIASGTDTSIWIWWKTAGADSQPAEDANFGKEQTWDDGGNNYFKMVQHLNEDPTPNGAQAIDSTQYDNDGTSGGTMAANDLVTGAFAGGTQGKAWDFDGNNDHVEVDHSASLNIADGVAPFSVVVWLYGRDEGSKNVIIEKNGSWQLRWAEDNITLHETSDWSSSAKTNNGVIPENTWKHFALVYDGSDCIFYVDGVDVTADSSIDPLTTTNNALFIGAEGGSGHVFDGIMDEFRLSATNRTAAWINAEFENQNDPNAFIVEGTPEATGINLNVGDAWKAVEDVQINRGDVWKTIAEIHINIGDAWKRLF